MKTSFALVALLSISVVLAGGCGSSGSGDDGVKSGVLGQESELSQIAKKVNGDYKKLSDAEKKKFLAAYGNKSTAMKMVKMMAHPPNEAKLNQKK